MIDIENCYSPGGNLVTKNVNAYSQYAICSGCEHFKCARVKDIRKANIMNGSEKFVCTKCFASNTIGIVLDKLVAPLKNVPIEIQVEIIASPEAGDILLLEETEVTLEEDVTPITRGERDTTIFFKTPESYLL